MRHTCAPVWEFHQDDMHADDEWQAIYAAGARDAAEAAASMYDADDLPLTRHPEGHTIIRIRDPRTLAVTIWRCWATISVDYQARPVMEPPYE
jgi:hypothetical protein